MCEVLRGQGKEDSSAADYQLPINRTPATPVRGPVGDEDLPHRLMARNT